MDIHSATATNGLIADVNKPVLSLCIPTYNRRDKLARLVNGVTQNIQDAGGKIELCISDNASTDGTHEYLTGILSANKYISVTTQSENVGFDRNYAGVFSMASGKYVWVLGDDDIIMENGLEKLLQSLQTESPDYAFVHIVPANGDEPTYFPDMKPGKYPGTTLHTMLCKEGLDMFGFIGSHVFPKSSVDILRSTEGVLTSGWPHLLQVLAASDNIKFFLVTEPLARQISDGLFWSSANWVLVNMRKIDILTMYTPKWSDRNFRYFRLAQKTVLSNSTISNLVNAKIVESNRFSEISDKAWYYFKKSKGTLKWVILLYIIVMGCIKYLPVGFILSKLKPAYYKNKIKEYEDFHRERSALEGYSREPAN